MIDESGELKLNRTLSAECLGCKILPRSYVLEVLINSQPIMTKINELKDISQITDRYNSDTDRLHS